MKTTHEIDALIRMWLHENAKTAGWLVISATMSSGRKPAFDVTIDSRDGRPWWRFALPAAPWHSDGDIRLAYDAALHAWSG